MADRETLFDGEKLRVVKRGKWEFVERKSGDAVAMLAITPDETVLLVEQHREPVGERVIELPAGVIDEGEDPDETAARELMEETGYRAGDLELLASGPTTPGLASEKIYMYLATKIEKVKNEIGVEGEKLTLHEVPLATLGGWLREQKTSIDLKVWTALGLYHSR